MTEAIIPHITIRTRHGVIHIETLPESVRTGRYHRTPIREDELDTFIVASDSRKGIADMMP